MGLGFEFIFEIERSDFTKEKISELIKVILDSYQTKMDEAAIRHAADKIYDKGKGNVEVIRAEIPYMEGSPKGVTLAACTIDNNELRGEYSRLQRDFKKVAIREDKCWISIGVQDWEVASSASMSKFINDMIMVHLFLKPNWGRGGTGIGGWTTDWARVIANCNFFTPTDIKRIGKGKFAHLSVYRKINLPDEGIYLQIQPDAYEERKKALEFDPKEVAQKLGYELC